MDVVVSDWGDGHVQWYENSGGENVTFALHEVGYSESTAYAVVAADVDGDLDVDLLVTSASTFAMTLFENGGDSLSWTEHLVPTPDTTYGCHVEDVDGDSDMDLLSASMDALPDSALRQRMRRSPSHALFFSVAREAHRIHLSEY